MTRPHALALSDKQMALVTQGARFIPPEVRDFYLRRISDALGNIKQPSNADLYKAVNAVLLSVKVPVYHFGAHIVGDGD
jgi:hypothetical protein